MLNSPCTWSINFTQLADPNDKKRLIYHHPIQLANLSRFCAVGYRQHRAFKRSGRLHRPQSQNSVTYKNIHKLLTGTSRSRQVWHRYPLEPWRLFHWKCCYDWLGCCSWRGQWAWRQQVGMDIRQPSSSQDSHRFLGIPYCSWKLNDTNLLRHVRYFYLYLFVFILQAFQVIFSTRLRCYSFMKGLNARFSDPVLWWASIYRTAPLAFFMG